MTQYTSRQEWGNLALVKLSAFAFGFTGFVVAMDTIVLPVLVLSVAPEGLKNTYLGVLSFSGLVLAALLQPLVGWYSDRTRSRLGQRVPYMLWGCIFVSVGIAGIAFAREYLRLFGVWMFVQGNVSIAYGPYQALIRDLIPVGRIGVASAFKILGDSVGGVAMIAISGALIGHYTGPESIKWLWFTLGAMGATLLVTTAITSSAVRPGRTGVTSAGPRPARPSRPAPALHPHLNWFLASRFLMITAVFIYPTYGLFFLRDVVGVPNPAQAVGTMIFAIGGALALSVYPAGWLSDRVGRKPVVFAGALAAAVGTIAMLSADSATQVVVTATLMGASVGAILSASWAMANEMGTQGREGLHMGVVNLSTVAGAGIAKILGPGVDLLNSMSPGLGYSGLLVSCAGLFVLGSLLLLPVRTTLRPVHRSEDSTSGAAR